MNENTAAKFDEVRKMLRGKRVLVAFSGGVDSTVLAVLAKKNALATRLLTVDSITFPRKELDFAKSIANEIGLPLEIIQVDELANEDMVQNPPDRCYHCKKELSAAWLETARRLGFDIVVDGTNASDMLGHRPGSKALEEAGVLSPFKMVGITKGEIRDYARANGLSVAERPSMACLSSRFPYGTSITEERVRMIDAVENTVREIFGVNCVRARYHGDIVRIEVGADERSKMFDTALLDELTLKVKDIGFKYVALDVQGYRTGSMDEVLAK